MDHSLFQLLLLLFRHGDRVGGWGVGLVVQRAEFVGSHVSNGSTRAALQLEKNPEANIKEHDNNLRDQYMLQM